MVQRVVVLGDVIASRDVPDREEFGKRLHATCEEANETASEYVTTPFEVIKGVDEIGGVLRDLTHLYHVVDVLAAGVRPERLRLAAAPGEIDVTGESASEMDGPAFHQASSTLAWMESEGLLFDVAHGDDLALGAVASQIHLIQLLKHRWTEHQREIVTGYERHESQSAVAEELNISQPAVSRALRRAQYRDLRHAEQRVTAFLRGYL